MKNLVLEANSMGSTPFHAVLGSGCSAACAGLAELSPIWSIPVLSWGCTSPALSDTSTYPYFSRTEQSGASHALGFAMIVKYMKWKRLGSVVLSEDSLFYISTQTALVAYCADLELDVDMDTVHIEDGDEEQTLREIATSLASSGVRVVTLQAYAANVVSLLCAFHIEGLFGSHWAFMSWAWFTTGWLSGGAAATSCSVEGLLEVATGMVTTTSGTWSLNETQRTLIGESPLALKEEYYAYMEANSSTPANDYAALMYDSVWTLALAMKAYLVSHPTALSDAPDETFLAQFTATIVEQDFMGASGRVHYDSAGDRIGPAEIRQFDKTESMVLKGSCTASTCLFLDTIDFGLSEPWDPEQPDVLNGRVPSSSPADCDEGLILDLLSNRCEACPTGKTLLQIDTSKSCACDAGSNISAADSTSCTTCPLGRYAATVGVAGSCTACPTGSYADLVGSTGCTRCPIGSWQSETGSSMCHSCSSSKSSQVLGADSEDLCLCPIGTIAVQDNKVKGSTSSSCVSCMEGMDCTSWNTTIPKTLSGYMLWHTGSGAAPGLPGVFECSTGSQRCPGGAIGSCNSGRQGLLCSECQTGLAAQNDGSCGPCSTGSTATAVLFIGLTLLALLLLYCWSTRQRLLGGEYAFFIATFASIVLTFCQTLAVLDMLAVEWGSPLDGILEVMRIFLFDVDMLNFSCVASMSEVTAYAMWVVLLPAMTISLGIPAAVHCFWEQKRSLISVRTAAGCLNSLAFISYSALILSIFQCEEHPSGVLTVRSRGSVICWTSREHHDLLIVGSLFLLWPLGFLCCCLWAVYQLPQQLAKANVDFLRQWEFLFGRFRNGCQWFSLVVLLRGLSLSLVSVFTNAAVQIVVMQVILLGFHTLTCTQRPWRTRSSDFLDRFLLSPSLIMTMVVAPFFVDASDTEFVAWMPFVALFCCVIAASCLCLFQVFLFVKRRNQKPYQFFLCHHKVGAGSFARLLKMQLKSSRRIVGDVWLDSDNLTDMTLLLAYVLQAKFCVALCSEQLLMRPWCLGELTTAFQGNVSTVLVRYPNFSFFDERTIEQFESVVPDINKLLVHGVDLYSVQQMLLWFPTNHNILLELPLSHQSVSTLTIRLAMLHPERGSMLVAGSRSTTERDIQQVSTNSQATSRAVIADISRTESLANAWIVAALLSRVYAGEPHKVPDVILEDSQILPQAKKVIILCSQDCFHTPHMVKNLAICASHGVQSLPIITEEEFRFPGESFFQELEATGLPNCEVKVSTIIPIIRSVFQEIAIVLKPADYSTTEAILAVRATEIARRLDGALSALSDSETPKTSTKVSSVLGSPTSSRQLGSSTTSRMRFESSSQRWTKCQDQADQGRGTVVQWEDKATTEQSKAEENEAEEKKEDEEDEEEKQEEEKHGENKPSQLLPLKSPLRTQPVRNLSIAACVEEAASDIVELSL